MHHLSDYWTRLTEISQKGSEVGRFGCDGGGEQSQSRPNSSTCDLNETTAFQSFFTIKPQNAGSRAALHQYLADKIKKTNLEFKAQTAAAERSLESLERSDAIFCSGSKTKRRLSVFPLLLLQAKDDVMHKLWDGILLQPLACSLLLLKQAGQPNLSPPIHTDH